MQKKFPGTITIGCVVMEGLEVMITPGKNKMFPVDGNPKDRDGTWIMHRLRSD